jgi:hypothetical protein
LLVCLTIASATLVILGLAGVIPRARADNVAYPMDATAGPGYHLPNAEAAIACRQQLCDNASHNRGSVDLVGDVKSDVDTRDEFQLSYLVDKAVKELFPTLIWQLRNSAAHYRPPAG